MYPQDNYLAVRDPFKVRNQNLVIIVGSKWIIDDLSTTFQHDVQFVETRTNQGKQSSNLGPWMTNQKLL